MAGFKVAANLGSLQGDTLLTKEQVHGKAAEPLAPTIPEEKAKQMSGDTPLLRGLAETRVPCSQIDAVEINSDGTLPVGVDVTNTRSVAAVAVVQLCAGYDGSPVERPVKELKGFSKVHLASGQTERVDSLLTAKEPPYNDERQVKWIVEPLACSVCPGPFPRTEHLLSARFGILA